MVAKSIQIFIEDLEETVLRLHTYMRGIEEPYDQFKEKKKFLRQTGTKKLSEKIQKEMKAWDEYHYYRGKFYAYLFVLDKLGSDVPKILERLRGLKWVGNTVFESKAHYSEVYGHFDTDAIKSNQKFPKVGNKKLNR